MKALTIARTNVVRLLRDRSNIFFVFIFPMVLILLIGATFAGGVSAHIAVVAENPGPLGDELVAALDAGDLSVDRYDDEEAALDAVARGRASAGVVLPSGYDERLRAGEQVEVGYLAVTSTTSQALQETVQAAIAEQAATIRAARFASDRTGTSFPDALAQAQTLQRAVPGVEVVVREAGSSPFEDYDAYGQFDLGASQELLLFMFLTSLAGSAALIETRRLGVATRMLSTPTRTREILLGEAGGRFGVALVQGTYIVLGTIFVFQVNWGSALGTAAIVTLFALVSAGGAMLMGALFRNDAQASGAGIGLGLGLAALGGCMAPLEVFTPTMQKVAHVTPHAWALDGFAELVRRDGGFLDILPELGVLAAFAAVLLGVSTWRLHRVLVAH